jgi:hypothetical protein
MFTTCSTTTELDQLPNILSPREPGSRHPAIIFMRGHQPPECLTRIGATCHANPLFFQRHLEYRWASRRFRLFSSPSLPSASFNTIRLRLVTIGERGGHVSWRGHSDVQALRAKGEDAMVRYLHDVNREFNLHAGDSIVRAFNVHSAQYFSIEQDATIVIQQLNSKWVTLIWTDVGHDLGNGPEGPWQPDKGRAGASTKSPFLPTLHHFPDPATKKKLSECLIPESHQSRGPFVQSASLLAENYGVTLDPSLLAADAIYSLIEILEISANSICQLLNLTETIIDQCTGYSLFKSQDYSLANLSYHLDVLIRFENRLRENIHDLEQYQSLGWPITYNNSNEDGARSNPRALEAAQIVLTDFRNLLSRTTCLSARCQSGMATCMNSAAIAESQRAIAQAMSVEQLTRLAFFYIPLSFTSSFFGMNLTYFGTGNVQLWVWFATSVPLVLLSYIALAWLGGKWL